MSSPADDGKRTARLRPADGDTRPAHEPARPLTVAVTGAAGHVGAAVLRHLARHDGVGRSVGLVPRGSKPEGEDWPEGVDRRAADLLDPSLAERLADVDVLVHTDLDASPDTDPAERTRHNVRGTETVLTAAAAAGVHRVILRSSAMVYGALPDNPVPIPDCAPLRAVPDGSLIADLLEIERLGRRAPRAHLGLHVTVLRPAIVTGPGVDTVFTRHFEAPRLLVVKDTEPCWQFCHLEDLAGAFAFAAAHEEIEGAYNVASPGWLGQEQIEESSGLRRMELPAGLALGAAERLHRLHLTPAPATDLQYVMHPWAVSAERLEAAGYVPKFGNEEAFQALLDEVAGHHAALARRLGKKDAAASLGAAGATVALVGTAALVRRARKKRRT
ncbi:NAD-dependent epimerase/dehydratase family protein [Actinospica sp. MGRD01-02]|uniref:NAD-dependent epimerase/dehydratase family protein n=1 Tax=Actinospica acidithermotolerans TaxID=2828514 RepID=A0A941EFE2_9ACTN|nr:NAD-dependent epimerase/dehydratase family protein [Actinospica acidithermotolerans]MBR7830402.1 NAD-dependent epimerase/dehydratase family protein [Actinospica acidithermotolerans]